MARRDEGDEPRKIFRIQKKRLGTIRFLREDGEFGFITAEDFRDDVFFHRTAWESLETRPVMPEVGMFVEFEIDDELFSTEKRLRAVIVRRTERPEGKKLSGRDATFQIVTHHPRARRKRPDWRD